MEPLITSISPKKLAGISMSMSLFDNRTGALWSRFMPRRAEIPDAVGSDLYSLQVYPAGYFDHFDPATLFTKWALMEVTGAGEIPEGMKSFLLPGGLYARFLYKGRPSEGQQMFEYIYRVWLPGSGYHLADRPHFEVLGPAYKNDDPGSEEEIWIPVDK